MERILWLACLGALVPTALLYGRAAKTLRLCLGFVMIAMYAGFMYGLLLAAQSFELENSLTIITLTLNALLLAITAAWVVGRRGRKEQQTAALLLLVVTAVLIVPQYEVASLRYPWLEIPFSGWTTVPEGDLAVHYIDVGQGDAILIQSPGKTVLIDGGSRGAGTIVVTYLQALGVTHIDLVIATHPHEDHIGGLLAVLEAFSVGEVWDPGVAHTSQTFENWLQLIDEKDIPFTEAREGLTRDLGGGARLDVLRPVSPSSSRLNDASIVTRLVFGQVSFLFTGDAEGPSELEMIAGGQRLRSTVLKVGHHGSKTSTTPDFLTRVSPTYAVITVGDGNRYFHPHQDILDLLKNNGIRTFRTDLNGTVVFFSDGSGVTVRVERNADNTQLFAAPPGR